MHCAMYGDGKNHEGLRRHYDGVSSLFSKYWEILALEKARIFHVPAKVPRFFDYPASTINM